MGIFGLLKDVVLTPLDLIQDSITLGGAMIDEDPALAKRFKSMKNNLDETRDD